MGKKGGGSSWLTAVKRAFRSSPSKDSDKKPVARQRDEQQQQLQQQEEEKKKEKRRWLFRKPSPAANDPPTPAPAPASAPPPAASSPDPAITVAAANPPPYRAAIREQSAAVAIQTAFRGYLARRALRALRGLVKLQALIRGHNVRRQATMTLRCMQALVRVQARVRDQRLRLLSPSNSSCISDGRFPADLSLSDRRSLSRDESSVAEEWDEQDEILAMKRQRERALAYAFSNQFWRSDRNLSLSMSVADQSFGNRGRRASTDQRMPPMKTLEIDKYHHSPSTPSPARPRVLQVRSASPRLAIPPAHTPRPSSYSQYSGGATSVPNYMAATESAKARLRSQSTPRQRPETTETEHSATARRRLAFPVPDPAFFSGAGGRADLLQSLRSPGTFNGSSGRERFIVEHRSTISSSCADSLLGEMSPSSTADLRRRRR